MFNLPQDNLAIATPAANNDGTVALRRSARLVNTPALVNSGAGIENATPLTTSTPRFPDEILVRIFKYALPGPRIIAVWATTQTDRDKFDLESLRPTAAAELLGSDDEFDTCTTAAHYVIPTPLLHVCFMSRQLALDHYNPAFGAQLNGKPHFNPPQMRNKH